MAQQFGGGFDSVHPRQADVHEDQVRLRLFAKLYGIRAVFRFPYHPEFRAPLQDGLHPVANQFVIIDENNVEWHSYPSAASGTAARTVVPVLVSLAIERSSPAWAA